MVRRRITVGVGLLASALLVVGASVPAQAATTKALGNITCSAGFPQPQEIHSKSTSKGDVIHEIYGGYQLGGGWPTTSRLTMGYSSTYTGWDGHHWLYVKNESGGKIRGSGGVTSGSLYCT